MKIVQFKKMFQASALALALSTSGYVFAQSSDEIVAIVNNSAILKSDLNQGINEIKAQYEANNANLPPDQILAQQALEQLILREAQLEQVKRFNVQPTENELNAAVLNVAKQSGSPNLADFQMKLDQQQAGLYNQVRNSIAENLAISKLRQQVVVSRIKISDQDVANFLKTPLGQAALGTQVHVLHARLSGNEAKQIAQPVREALMKGENLDKISKTYSTNSTQVEVVDMGFKNISEVPLDLAARISALDVGQTSMPIEMNNDIHLVKLLDRKTSDQKNLVTQYETRHILIQPTEVVSLEMAEQMINSLYQRLQAGEDFATLAATFSNDPGSALDGGRLGWVSSGMMVPEFEDKMKNTPQGEFSAPFQTQFGWHILQVTNVREQDMTKESQERMARQILGERQFDAEQDSWLRELRNNVYVDIKDPSLNRKNNQ